MAVKGNYDQVNRLCCEVANSHGWGFVNINLRPYYSEGSKPWPLRWPSSWAGACRITWWPLWHQDLFTPRSAKASVNLRRQAWWRKNPCASVGHRRRGVHPLPRRLRRGGISLPRLNQPHRQIHCHRESCRWPLCAGCGPTKRRQHHRRERCRDRFRHQAAGGNGGDFYRDCGGHHCCRAQKLAESGKIHPDETTVAYITGNGLKTAEAVSNVIGAPLQIDARLDSFNQAWGPGCDLATTGISPVA